MSKKRQKEAKRNKFFFEEVKSIAETSCDLKIKKLNQLKPTTSNALTYQPPMKNEINTNASTKVNKILLKKFKFISFLLEKSIIKVIISSSVNLKRLVLDKHLDKKRQLYKKPLRTKQEDNKHLAKNLIFWIIIIFMNIIKIIIIIFMNIIGNKWHQSQWNTHLNSSYSTSTVLSIHRNNMSTLTKSIGGLGTKSSSNQKFKNSRQMVWSQLNY